MTLSNWFITSSLKMQNSHLSKCIYLILSQNYLNSLHIWHMWLLLWDRLKALHLALNVFFFSVQQVLVYLVLYSQFSLYAGLWATKGEKLLKSGCQFGLYHNSSTFWAAAITWNTQHWVECWWIEFSVVLGLMMCVTLAVMMARRSIFLWYGWL